MRHNEEFTPLMSATKTNPTFYDDQLRLLLGNEPERLERIHRDPDNLELLTWNVFASLETHTDRDYLAYRMQQFGGSAVRAPVKTSLWTGRDREPRLMPSSGYVTAVRQRAQSAGGGAAATQDLEAALEVPVRLESPDMLMLVDTMWDRYPPGQGGRDRIIELVDAGLDHARRLSKILAVTVVYRSGTSGAADVSMRMRELRDRAVLAEQLPHRASVPAVVLRELPWQQLARVWQQEIKYLRLGGQPVRGFIQHLRGLGLL